MSKQFVQKCATNSSANRHIAAPQEHWTVIRFLNMNEIPFLHAKSYKITFLTSEPFTSIISDNIIK